MLGADRLDVGQAPARPCPAAVRSDRPVERRPRRRPQQRAQARDGAGDIGRLARRLGRRARRRPQAARAVVRDLRPVRQRRADDARGARLRRRLPRGRDLGRRRAAFGVEDHAQQVGPGDAVDHAVVHLADQRPATATKSLGEPRLPQRLRAVELLRHHAADEVAQLLVAARRGQRGAPHVVVEVEVPVVHPDRAGERERRKAHPLAVARDEVELGRDRVDNGVLRRRRALEDAYGADVHVADRVLDVQERGIERTHGLHAGKHALMRDVAPTVGMAPVRHRSAEGRPRLETVLGVALNPARAGGRSARCRSRARRPGRRHPR